MGWDQISALATLGGTLVVLGGTVAAVVQLKHLRLTYQIESYLEMARLINSREMVEAREYLETQDFRDPKTLEAALNGSLDPRIAMYGGFFQAMARLLNKGVIDRDLFAPFVMVAPHAWLRLKPLAYAWRQRHRGNPRWLDVEVMILETLRKGPLNPRDYPMPFRGQLEEAVATWRERRKKRCAATRLHAALE